MINYAKEILEKENMCSLKYALEKGAKDYDYWVSVEMFHAVLYFIK